MSGLLTRRRAMMAVGAEPAETWDFEWDYSQGKLEEQTGWQKNAGTAFVTELTSSGEKISGSSTTTSAYIRLEPRSGATWKNIGTTGYGVVETTFSVHNSPSGMQTRVAAYVASSKRVTVVGKNGAWFIYTSGTQPQIGTYADDTEYTIRIVMKDTVADIYINGQLVSENFDTSLTSNGNGNQIFYGYVGEDSYMMLKSFKIKQDRIN